MLACNNLLVSSSLPASRLWLGLFAAAANDDQPEFSNVSQLELTF